MSITVVQASDLDDKILSRHATVARVAQANAWLVSFAARLGVAEASILAAPSWNVKRAGVLQLACIVALAEAGQNQGAFDGKEQDVYTLKHKLYAAELAEISSTLTVADFTGSTDPTDDVESISFRIHRA